MNLEKYKNFLFILFIFIIFSFGGWLWELLYEFLRLGTVANHGFLHGPWLPIYGTGGVLCYLLLNRYKKSPLIVFMGAFVFCTIIEYITAWYLETCIHNKWWSYVEIPFNIDGRICLLSSISFGLVGVIAIYLLFPLIKKIFDNIELKKIALLCLIFISIFSIDLCYSFKKPNIVKKYRVIDIHKIGENKIFKK